MIQRKTNEVTDVLQGTNLKTWTVGIAIVNIYNQASTRSLSADVLHSKSFTEFSEVYVSDQLRGISFKDTDLNIEALNKLISTVRYEDLKEAK